ncbi:PREDICTED: inactive protein RESTRICTED TEV MOVEMENT 2-like [Populus euphratica]|uniref:Inactive protein RESTRICTED TEV MOVEMENT 2-like n=1 Tax=Populus euphratica TaxID=75702 RepID=A0AAJ6T710_POPEU|nr:PREDICTED: inactive protein RESTRICTED TEV MOVEMENT 2-like [Populus euphratica]
MESKPNGNAAAARVHEEFEPSTDWIREPGADTLRIYLPGFKKEQLKVQVTSSRILRVSGERQLSGNRWSTFGKEIPISTNYDTNEIAARFEKGILHVKHPKIIVADAPKPREQARSPVEASTYDQKPAQEKTQPPPLQPPGEPEQKSSSVEGKVEPPSESATKPKKQPQEKPASEQQPEDPVAKAGESEGPENDNLSPRSLWKEKAPVKHEWNEKSTKNGQAEAKGIATTSKSAKPENLVESSLDSTNLVKDKAEKGLLSGTEKLRMESYNKDFSGLVMDMKKPGTMVNLVLVILFIMVLGMYGRNAIRSLKKSDN